MVLLRSFVSDKGDGNAREDDRERRVCITYLAILQVFCKCRDKQKEINEYYIMDLIIASILRQLQSHPL